MEAILAIVTKFVQCFVDPIGHEISYLSEYQRNIKILHEESDKLNDMRYDVQQSVDAAIRNGDEIKTTTDHWLAYVEQNIAEAKQLEIESIAKNRCLRGWSPNWIWHYKLSKKAFKKKLVINELKGTKPSDQDISIRIPPLNIQFPQNIKQATPEVEVDLDHIKSEKSGKVAVGSTSTLIPKYVQQKQTVDDIMAQQRDLVQQIIFQQKEAAQQIFDALEDEDCEIIGVYGMGGIGKTTLVKEIGKMAKACGLFDEVVLVVVSQNRHVRKIQGEIADILGIQFSEESEMGRAGRLYKRLIGKQKILIILDDVWAAFDLADIGIPHGVEGQNCKIMVTTRQRNICSIMGFKKRKEIPLKFLSEEASLDLLKMNAELDGSVSPQLDVIAMEVARECGGVPLAIVTVGRALQDKDLEKWRAALQQIKKSKQLNINDVEQDVFSCIKLSYEYLRSEEAKECLLLCCLFPEDHDIKIEDIARYGMGKGLFKEVDTMEEARRQTKWMTKCLKDSCLLLDSGEDGCVKMHDVVRDFAILIASEERNGFLVKSGSGLKEWPNSNMIGEKIVISLMANHIQTLPKDLCCPRLEMLLLGMNDGFQEIAEEFFEGMLMLKVLDLSERMGARSLRYYFGSSSSTRSFLRLPLSFEALLNLRTLNLEHCNLVDIRVLGKLKKLEILSLYGSDIEELPYEIGQLSNLRLLDLNFCQNLKILPANLISKLIRLHELYMGESFKDWEVADGENEGEGKTRFSEVVSLSQLTNLCVQVPNPESFPMNFHFQTLEKFEIAIGRSHNRMTCYPSSRSLYLQEIKTSIPESVKVILQITEDLTIFCLDEFLLKSVLGSNLRDLNRLKSLNISACVDTASLLPKVENGTSVLPCLEKLSLRLLDDLMVMCRSSLPSGSLERLEILRVEHCRNLWNTVIVRSLVQRLLNLKVIEVCHCKSVTTIFELRRVVVEKECLLLSNLSEIKLSYLPKVSLIWNGLNSISRLVSLSKLRVVDISICHNLKDVFPYSAAQNLLQLEVLKIYGCDKLETIVEKSQEASESQNACCPNLKVVEVKYCPKLKTLFSVVEAEYLCRLEEIEVTHCDSLVELFSNDKEIKEEEETEDGIILLPRLNSIQMNGLRNLNRLCAEHFAVDLPSLEKLMLLNCPKLNNFASDASRYGFNSAPRLKKTQFGEDTIVGATTL